MHHPCTDPCIQTPMRRFHHVAIEFCDSNDEGGRNYAHAIEMMTSRYIKNQLTMLMEKAQRKVMMTSRDLHVGTALFTKLVHRSTA